MSNKLLLIPKATDPSDREQQAVVIRDVKECLKNVSQKRAEILSRIVEFQSDCEHEVNLKEEELEELRNKTDSLQAQMSTLNSTIELLEREKARLSMVFCEKYDTCFSFINIFPIHRKLKR